MDLLLCVYTLGTMINNIQLMSKTIITCIENILPLFHTNIRHGLRHTNNKLVFTNKYNSTLHAHHKQIESIKRVENSAFVYSYESALQHYKSVRKQDDVMLLVGYPATGVTQQLSGCKVITLEEMCALYPEKVPLSYRSKDNSALRKNIEQRTGLNLTREPHINQILYTSAEIRMWDEAIQVVIDHQPSNNIIQYQQPEPSPNFYKLTMNDFMKGVSRCYQIVHHSPLPNIINFNVENKQADWFITQIMKDGHNAGSHTIVIDEDLVNDRQALVRKYANVEVERVDENSSLWV